MFPEYSAQCLSNPVSYRVHLFCTRFRLLEGSWCVEPVVSNRENGSPSSSLSPFEERFREMENMHERDSRRLLLRIPEVMSALGLGRTKVYELIATGELPVVRVGRAVRISSTALEKWVEARQQQDSAV